MREFIIRILLLALAAVFYITITSSNMKAGEFGTFILVVILIGVPGITVTASVLYPIEKIIRQRHSEWMAMLATPLICGVVATGISLLINPTIGQLYKSVDELFPMATAWGCAWALSRLVFLAFAGKVKAAPE